MTWRRVLWGLLLLAVIALGGFTYVVGGPGNLIGMLRYDQREKGSLAVGERAPEAELWSLDGRFGQPLLAPGRKRPLVLIFGSFT